MRAAAKQPPARLLGRLFDEGSTEVGEDRPLGTRRDERACQPLDVHVGALAVASLRTIDRDHREDAICAHVGTVAQSDHPGVVRIEHMFDSSSPRSLRLALER